MSNQKQTETENVNNYVIQTNTHPIKDFVPRQYCDQKQKYGIFDEQNLINLETVQNIGLNTYIRKIMKEHFYIHKDKVYGIHPTPHLIKTISPTDFLKSTLSEYLQLSYEFCERLSYDPLYTIVIKRLHDHIDVLVQDVYDDIYRNDCPVIIQTTKQLLIRMARSGKDHDFSDLARDYYKQKYLKKYEQCTDMKKREEYWEIIEYFMK